MNQSVLTLQIRGFRQANEFDKMLKSFVLFTNTICQAAIQVGNCGSSSVPLVTIKRPKKGDFDHACATCHCHRALPKEVARRTFLIAERFCKRRLNAHSNLLNMRMIEKRYPKQVNAYAIW